MQRKPQNLQEIQNKKLRAITKHAYENVPLYRRKFDSVRIKPNDIKSVADLQKVPVTTKPEIQASSLRDVAAWNVDINKCIRGTTSGSTGIPLSVIVDKRAVDFWGARLELSPSYPQKVEGLRKFKSLQATGIWVF